ncbi:MAG TPA: hypothetical protein VN829_06055 [Dongiaceae bacterium]|nr:hypothetical protein [Dongiaceae bacterium]
MKTKSQIEKLRKLEEECQRLRNSLGVSRRGEVVFQAPNSMWSDYDIVVEADGIGGAKLLVVQGNYPIDYSTKSEQVFATEDAACEAAEELLQKHG